MRVSGRVRRIRENERDARGTRESVGEEKKVTREEKERASLVGSREMKVSSLPLLEK